MILTHEEAKRLRDDYMADPFDLIREVERAVIEKLCAGVEMPEAVDLANPNDEKACYGHTADQLRAYGAAQRLKALEDAEQVCATISDKFFKRDGGKWPELRTDAETGAGHCKDAIRALKGEAP